MNMKVVYWNIERGYNPDLIVKELKDLNADLYLLSELDRGVKRTGCVDMFERIQDGLGLPGEYVREFYEIDTPWRRIIPWGGPGGGEIGNAIFSRYPILKYRSINLPTLAPLTYSRTTLFPELFQPRDGCRKAQVFTIALGGTPLTIVSAHLELMRCSWTHRRHQLEAALQDVDASNVLLAGDFNCVGGSVLATLFGQPGFGEVREVRKWLAARGLTDPFTDKDTTCGRLGINAKLDWIAAGTKQKIKTARMVRTVLSDHAYLLVDYEMSSTGAVTRLQSGG